MDEEISESDQNLRMLRAQRRRWLCKTAARMAHETFDTRGARLRIIRQLGLDADLV